MPGHSQMKSKKRLIVLYGHEIHRMCSPVLICAHEIGITCTRNDNLWPQNRFDVHTKCFFVATKYVELVHGIIICVHKIALTGP